MSFSDSYADARRRFLDAAAEAGAVLTTHRNPVAPDDLATDVAWLGPANARKVLFVNSGTHGVEGYCGSAVQLALLTGAIPATLPPDTALLVVHALNPYGFAHDRRVDEGNVDVNRNFVDHAALNTGEQVRHGPPANVEYADLHGALVPKSWDGEARAAADGELMRLLGVHGERWVQAVVTHGQWTHPDGLFYGGTARVWSHRTLRTIAADLLPDRDRIAYIDLHTGLGPRGVGEPIFRGGRDDSAFSRAREWYGDLLSRSEDGSSSSTIIVGNTATAVADAVPPGTELTAITLEFGTVSGFDVLQALRADNWLSLQDRPDPGLRREIKHQIREAFCPSDPAWRTAVLARADVVLRQALAGLAAR